jgi:hypothetical protein
VEEKRLAVQAEAAKNAAEKKAREEAARLAFEAERTRIMQEKEKIVSTENEELYQGMIASADQAFNAKEYNVSRAWYYKSLEIKPGNAYPLGRIDEINQIVSSLQLSAADREFQQYIDKGDEAFRNNQPAIARSWYNRALGIRSNDSYSKSQLIEIQLKVSQNLQGDMEKTFNDYMAQGNKAFESKQFNVAKVWFQRAQQLKPGDNRPLEKLAAIREASH